MFLPDEFTVTLTPVLDASGNCIKCAYTVNGKPLSWMGRLIVGLLGGFNIKHVRVTLDIVQVSIPTEKLPYKITGLSSGKISITVKKK